MESSEGPTPTSVAVAILARHATGLAATVTAVRRQVYGAERIIVVGGDTDARHAAVDLGVEWISSTTSAIGETDRATHLWVLEEGVEPRPDALGALVSASERLEAAITGSKIVDVDDPGHLISSGYATDVFETPYTGLDADERDQGQYDVVRDVAAVSGRSFLVRRDLARGLHGPDPDMPPFEAAVDLCQRARLRGARVVVVPSSEVLAPVGDDDRDGWRPQAARIRSMIKAYGPMTLAWALPAAFLSGFARSLLAMFLGRWRFFHWIRAWLWNLVKLPGTLRSRHGARSGRLVGESELFRYQVGGPVALKAVVGELSERVRSRLPGEDRLSIDTIGEEMRRPAFVVGAVAALFVLVATRSIWGSGLPAVGFSLPLNESGPAAISAYAGGWNPAGLGSVDPLRPFIGLTGIIHTLLFDNRRFTEYVLMAGSWLLGVWGTVRLLRTWGIRAVAGTLAGIVYVAGPAARGIAAETAVGVTVALGVLPWVLRLSVARFPESAPGRVGRVAAIGALTALAAALAPLTLAVPAVALLVWAVFRFTDGAAWRAFGVALVGAVLAVPALFPWAGAADLKHFVTAGDAYWAIPLVTAAAAGVAALGALIAAPGSLALPTGWGAIIAVVGVAVSRSHRFGPGREVEVAGLTLAALGVALIVGSSLEAITRSEDVSGWRRIVAGVSVAGSVLLLAASATTLVGGRAGYPSDEYREAFLFSAARPGDPAASRILVVGGPGALPGESRTVSDVSYRLVSAPMPGAWETFLPAPRIGDDELRDALRAVLDGESTRVGEVFASFGIRWIVVMARDELDPFASAWKTALAGQLDLVPLGGGLANTTFENEAEHAVRAVTAGGTEWTRAGTGYSGPGEFGVPIEIRDNANDRWMPGEWRQAGWANETTASAGRVGFEPIEARRTQAMLAAAWLAMLGMVAWAGRRLG